MKAGAVIAVADSMFDPEEVDRLAKTDRPVLFERIVQNFQRAGVKDIVLVAGKHRTKMEKYLLHLGITFFPEDPGKTECLANCVSVGLQYLAGRCDQVLLCVMDVPFWSAETVTRVLQENEEASMPVCSGREGCPACVSGEAIEKVLRACEQSGIRFYSFGELFRRAEVAFKRIEVEDEGVHIRVNTVEEYEKLKPAYNERIVYPGVKVRLSNNRAFFGPGMVTLMNQIDRMGSVREACARTGISYSKGWKLIRNAESEVGYKLVERTTGGKNGGEAYITERGKKLLRLFEEFTRRMEDAADEMFKEIFLDSDLF